MRALRPGRRPSGTVRVALLPDVQTEREWIADHLHHRYQRCRAEGIAPPTAAVLVRRNADAAPMAEALRAAACRWRWWAGGLLSVPEVADLVAMLRLVADPTAGSAAMRVLTGPRWRLGRAISPRCGGAPRNWPATCRRSAVAGRADRRGSGPTPTRHAWRTRSVIRPASRYSPAGYRRIVALANELTVLRGHLAHPLPDLVAEVRRVLGVDCEARAAQPVHGGWAGPSILTRSPMWSTATRNGPPHRRPSARLRWPACWPTWTRRRSSKTGYRPPAQRRPDRVQVLTVHAAKGWSGRWWRCRTCRPGCSRPPRRLAPGSPTPQTCRRCCGRPRVGGLPGVPVLDTSGVVNRKQLSDKISAHRRLLEQRRVDEERRLLYVAITRAEDTLLLSAITGGRRNQTARAVGFPLRTQRGDRPLCRRRRGLRRGGAVGGAARSGRTKPVARKDYRSNMAADPLGERRGDVERGAALVAAAMAADPPADPPAVGRPTSTRCWPSGHASRGNAHRHCLISCRSATSSSWTVTGRRSAPADLSATGAA
ncbi:uvrD-like helicase C-terminal domain protein [Mycobacterium xenopi 3993]|nr:uvrD-like helicase C-terminal domain protein [Mycobacterium xenopi 3993]